ncbi:hypothetical protein J7E73_20220 [Paenibacillus albidus]|uniref:hypothetical protein n=1 Tax=Paenibacillus albidus TaxID=2041023 RepID=UPI001BE4F291|nr:hypothetical protein [Paenibacillus albidus]MBT2291405.1 hypothetical protein [Paenibacillus albidus]
MTLLLMLNLSAQRAAGAAGQALPDTAEQVDLKGTEALVDQFMQERVGTEGGAPGGAVSIVQRGKCDSK